MTTRKSDRLVVIGLDCAEPSLVFDAWRGDLPNLNRLMDGGLWGRLESCHPPITMPAWACMMTGRDPGELGIYGFRNRAGRSYDALSIATSRDIREPAIWQVLSGAGRRVALLGVPGTYPPYPVNGLMVSCFLTPSNASSYTYPPALREEIEEVAGGYRIDVREFRTEDKARLLAEVREMAERRFRVARHILGRERWDLFAMVEMSPDRMHHGFWRHFDRGHRLHEPGNAFESAIHDHYVQLDAEIGRTVEAAGEASVLVVSDHGARRMEGGVRLNEWLIREGYLRLIDPPSAPSKLVPANVDWPATRAWGDGGYYGRVFLNVAGREPRGAVPKAGYEALRDEITAKLEAMEDHRGMPMGNRVLRPERLYRSVRNIAPDLLVYFGDLAWRSVGTVGGGDDAGIFTFENDTGPDDANHAQHGILIYDGPEVPEAERGREVQGASIYDIFPTILKKFRLPVPMDLRGKTLY
jgi:predicted AlkP superfamily phosphohydrolase/phosphomutase